MNKNLKYVFDFAIHVGVGIFIFIVIALAATFLGSLALYLTEQGAPSLTTQVLQYSKYILLTVDIALFTVFLIRASISMLNNIWMESE